MKNQKPASKPKYRGRNWIAVHAKLRTGAGTHGPVKYSRKTKHKKKDW